MAADHVDGPRPPSLSSLSAVFTRRGWSRRWVLIAATALAAVAAGIAVVVVRGGGPSAPAGSPAAYFVNGTGGYIGNSKVFVRDAHTGRITATVDRPGRDVIWGNLSATGDPHRFYLSTIGEATAGAFLSPRQLHLYRLQINDAGRVSSLTSAGNVPGGSFPTTVAASPDGQRVAYAVLTTPTDRMVSAYGPPQINIVDVRTGQRQEFTMPAGGYIAETLNWDGSGRYLLFNLGSSPGNEGLRILDTRSDRNLISSSRRIVPDQKVAPVLSADARHVYFITQQIIHGKRMSQIAQLDVATGRQTRIITQQTFKDPRGIPQVYQRLTRDPTGQFLLATDDHGTGYRINLTNKHTTRIRIPGAIISTWLTW